MMPVFVGCAPTRIVTICPNESNAIVPAIWAGGLIRACWTVCRAALPGPGIEKVSVWKEFR